MIELASITAHTSVREGMRLATMLAVLSAMPAHAQSLANSLMTIALNTCVSAAEAGVTPRVRTLFPGEPVAGLPPSELFMPLATFLTSDGRVFVALDDRGNCAVGDTASTADAHTDAIRRFEAWATAEIAENRYLDSGLPQPEAGYHRTFVFREPTNSPLLVSLVSQPDVGVLAVIAERALPVGGDHGNPGQGNAAGGNDNSIAFQ